MPLVNLKKVLSESIEKKYAVGSFNAANCQGVEAILAASEEKGTPVILSIAEVHFRYLDLEYFIPYVKNRICQCSVPVVLHLDHGLSFDTCIKAISMGFSSVMFDGSTLPIEENIEITKKLVEIAHVANVSVEAEIGHVGGGEGNLEEGSEVDRSKFTKPEDAVNFVEKTGVDALAIAVGTVHGPYKGTPEIDNELISKIRNSVSVPLVLHGGSGLSDDDFRNAVKSGISKVNFYTAMSIAAVEKIKKILSGPKKVSFPDLTKAATEKINEVVKHQIEVFRTKPLKI